MFSLGTRLGPLHASLESSLTCANSLPRNQAQVFTLGASVTRGIGTTDRKHSYANRLFEYIAHAFPHK